MNLVKERNTAVSNVEVEKEINDLECLLGDYERLFDENYVKESFLGFPADFNKAARFISGCSEIHRGKVHSMLLAALEILDLKNEINALKSELSS